MIKALARHWPEYLMEAAGLGLFMVSAEVFTILFEHPGSPIHEAAPDPVTRRVFIGIAMGMTAIGLIYSPWGRRSGAHLNPSVTLTFWRLGKVRAADAIWYVAAQFLGGAAGVLLVAAVAGAALAAPSVNYAVTAPGVGGPWPAFAAETAMSFGLMLAVLLVSNVERAARLTGLVAGALVATYIAIEAPLSGMSMNPARTVASALPAHLWTGLWIYFTAPILGMLAAADMYLRWHGPAAVLCAKLLHADDSRCIFCGKPAASRR